MIPDYEFKMVVTIPHKVLEPFDLILLDLDNTICYPETTKVDLDISQWVNKLAKEKKVVFVSNSPRAKKRSAQLQKVLHGEFFFGPKKPKRELYLLLHEKYNLKQNNTLMIGDRLLTDIWFAKRHNLSSLLVTPFSKKEHLSIRLVRKLEALLLWSSKHINRRKTKAFHE